MMNCLTKQIHLDLELKIVLLREDDESNTNQVAYDKLPGKNEGHLAYRD